MQGDWEAKQEKTLKGWGQGLSTQGHTSMTHADMPSVYLTNPLGDSKASQVENLAYLSHAHLQ